MEMHYDKYGLAERCNGVTKFKQVENEARN